MDFEKRGRLVEHNYYNVGTTRALLSPNHSNCPLVLVEYEM